MAHGARFTVHGEGRTPNAERRTPNAERRAANAVAARRRVRADAVSARTSRPARRSGVRGAPRSAS
ncbi:hypothetical protein C6P78_07500 [Burkholderia multivorans]|nr:hypothetical protein C6P78_07500 [Burkholderia multivorans]